MIPTESTINERDTHIKLGLELLSLIKNNFLGYNRALLSHYGNLWIKVFTIVVVLLFPAAMTKKSAYKKIPSALLSALFLVLMFVLSFGAYLIIGNTVVSDRAFMGADALLAVIAITDCNLFAANEKKLLRFISCACICLLVYGCAIYAIVRGNLYAKQNDYQKFRYTILLGDLAHIINADEHNTAYVVGNIGPSTSSNMEYKNYKLNIGSYSSGWTHLLIKDWNMELDFLATDSFIEKFNQQKELKAELESMPLLLSSYYHDIYGQNGRYLIKIKNPQVKEYEIK